MVAMNESISRGQNDLQADTESNFVKTIGNSVAAAEQVTKTAVKTLIVGIIPVACQGIASVFSYYGIPDQITRPIAAFGSKFATDSVEEVAESSATTVSKVAGRCLEGCARSTMRSSMSIYQCVAYYFKKD